MNKNLISVSLAALFFSTAALANDHFQCPSHPQQKWLPFSQIMLKAEQAGYHINSAEIDNNCYEIEVIDKNRRTKELHYDPVSGEIVNTSNGS